jgi:DNA-binding protein HU-beta
MNREELVTAIAASSGASKATVNKMLTAFINSVTSSLKQGDDVRLVGFGTFSILERKATTGRNPRTGAAIKIPASKRPRFRPGKQLVEAMN